MIREASAFAATLGERGKSLAFVNAPAEDLAFIPDQTVDLVIAAQAAHWFDWERLWPELSRVLRHGGTVALWVYSEMRFPQYPQLTPTITEYLQGTDPKTSLGPHWEPGRRILNNHLLDIVPPPKGWEDLTRVFFTGSHYPDLAEPHLDPILRKTTTWGGGLHGYLRTFSSLNRFHEKFPEDLNHPEGDIASRFLRALMSGAAVPLTEEGLAKEVEMEWPLALVLARKELDPNDPWRLRDQGLNLRIDAVKGPYDTKMAERGPPTSVEDTTERIQDWIGVQKQVLEMVEAEIESVPESHDEAAADAVEEPRNDDQPLSPSEEYEEGRLRYLELLDGKRTTLTWRLTFKESFDFALEVANQVDAEVSREDIPAGVQAWMTRMNERIAEIKEGLPEVEDDTDEVMAFEKLENLTPEDIARFEKAEALQGIVRVVEELVDGVSKEPIGDLIKELYVSATAEVTSEISVEE